MIHSRDGQPGHIRNEMLVTLLVILINHVDVLVVLDLENHFSDNVRSLKLSTVDFSGKMDSDSKTDSEKSKSPTQTRTDFKIMNFKARVFIKLNFLIIKVPDGPRVFAVEKSASRVAFFSYEFL